MITTLEHSPAHILQQLLIDLGKGTDPTGSSDWPIFYANEPDNPDSLIVVLDTVGRKDGRSMIGGEVFEHHGTNILVRSAKHPLGYAKIDSIAKALDEDVLNSVVTLTAVTGTSTAQYIINSISRDSTRSLGKGPTPSNRNFFDLNALISLRQTF
jgi:hypothetical protein